MENLFPKFGLKKKAGEILFCEHEPGSTVFFLLKGSVKLSKITKDREKNLAVLGSGAIFGEMSLLDSQPRSATCIAETDLELLEFDKDNFQFLIKSKPILGIQLLVTLVSRIVDQERKLRLLKHRKDEIKVLDTLVMLAEDQDIDPEAKTILVHTKKEIVANWVGLDSNHFEKTIKDLERIGRIEVTEQGILLKNIDSIRNVLEKELKELGN